jgi:hypothetical protein
MSEYLGPDGIIPTGETYRLSGEKVADFQAALDVLFLTTPDRLVYGTNDISVLYAVHGDDLLVVTRWLTPAIMPDDGTPRPTEDIETTYLVVSTSTAEPVDTSIRLMGHTDPSRSTLNGWIKNNTTKKSAKMTGAHLADVTADTTHKLSGCLPLATYEAIELRQRGACAYIEGDEAKVVCDVLAPAVDHLMRSAVDISVDPLPESTVRASWAETDIQDRMSGLPIEQIAVVQHTDVSNGTTYRSTLVTFEEAPFTSRHRLASDSSEFVVEIEQPLNDPNDIIVRYYFVHYDDTPKRTVEESIVLTPNERMGVLEAITYQLTPSNLENHLLGSGPDDD